MQSKNHRKDTAYWYWGIRESEIKFCTFTISWQIARWRKHLLDSLILKHKYPEKIFYTLYHDFTGTSESNVIQAILDDLNLNVDIDSDEIYRELRKKKKQNKKHRETSLNMLSTSQKYGKASGFLPPENIHFMEMIAGDALVCGGYLPLEKVNPFIYAKDDFVLITDDNVGSLQNKLICCFFKTCNKKVKAFLTGDKELEQYLWQHTRQNFVICSEDIRRYEKILRAYGLSDGEEYTIYPYFEAYRQKNYYIFDATTKQPVPINTLFNQKVAVITTGTRPEFRDIPISIFYNNHQKYDLYLKVENYADCISYDSKNILIFGAGIVGKFFKKFLDDNFPGIYVQGFVDSFTETGSKTFEGLPVFNVKDTSQLSDIDEVVIASVYYTKMKKELTKFFNGRVSISKLSYQPNSHSLFKWGENFQYCYQYNEKFLNKIKRYDCVLLSASCLDDCYYNLRELILKHNIKTYSFYPLNDLNFIDLEEDKKYIKLYEEID